MKEETSLELFSQLHAISAEDAAQLEAAGVLLRVLKPDMKQRLLSALKTAAHEIHPYVATCGEQVYISFAKISDETQRQRANYLIRQCQIGAKVDLSSLPSPLHRFLQPNTTRSRLPAHILALGGIAGIIIGILAMAVSILATAATELLFKVSLNEFGGMQITAVAFVIFAVIGWGLATMYFWRRLR